MPLTQSLEPAKMYALIWKETEKNRKEYLL